MAAVRRTGLPFLTRKRVTVQAFSVLKTQDKMPRYGRDYDDYWDQYYETCRCDYDMDEEGEVVVTVECDCCRLEKAEARRAEAKRAAEEAKLRATGWYDEITTIRHHMNRFAWLTGPEWFDARVGVFRDIFTALLGYERFLAAQPKFRSVVQEKITECRSSPRASAALAALLDQLDTLLAGLPARDDYKA